MIVFKLLDRLHWRVVKALIFVSLICGVLAGCADKPAIEVPVVGNNTCIPASDLPDHKVMKKVPSAPANATELYNLLLDERASHAKDDQDYNSLYKACVK
jgi:hypothetical protein